MSKHQPVALDESTLRLVVEDTVSETGTEFFKALVKNLSTALGTPARNSKSATREPTGFFPLGTGAREVSKIRGLRPIKNGFVTLRCALARPIRHPILMVRNEARWRDGKWSVIGIAGLTAARVFFRRQIH